MEEPLNIEEQLAVAKHYLSLVLSLPPERRVAGILEYWTNEVRKLQRKFDAQWEAMYPGTS